MKKKFVVGLVVMLLLTMIVAGNVSPVRSASTHPLLPGAQVAPYAQIVNGATAPSLKWAKGQPYPVVHGKAKPPPNAPPSDLNASVPSTVGGLWYAGSVYSGTGILNSWVITEISVPSADAPDSSEFYYVLLSIWDKAGSYDQIGFTDDFGVWGLAYSWTSGPCSSPTYNYNPDYFSLTPGQEYLFAITTVGAPNTDLEAYTVSTTGAITLIFDLSAPTQVSNPGLEQKSSYCGYYDYTDYEEVFGTTSYTQPDPYGAPGGFQWYFHENLNAPTSPPPWTFTTWKAFKTSNAPPGTSAKIGTYSGYAELVTISNFMSTEGYIKG